MTASQYSKNVGTIMYRLIDDILDIYAWDMGDPVWRNYKDVTAVRCIKDLRKRRRLRSLDFPYPYSNSTGYLVHQQGMILRPHFIDVFNRTSINPVTHDENYVQYMVFICRYFIQYNYPALMEEMGERNTLHVKFLLCCTFLAENLLYCVTRLSCYRCVPFLARILTIVYKRFMEPYTSITDGFDGLAEYSEFLAAVYRVTAEQYANMVFWLPLDSKPVAEIIESIRKSIIPKKEIQWQKRELHLFLEVPKYVSSCYEICPVCLNACDIDFFGYYYPREL